MKGVDIRGSYFAIVVVDTPAVRQVWQGSPLEGERWHQAAYRLVLERQEGHHQAHRTRGSHHPTALPQRIVDLHPRSKARSQLVYDELRVRWISGYCLRWCRSSMDR